MHCQYILGLVGTRPSQTSPSQTSPTASGYASAPELTRFKANVEDPRHSGVEAVHGVPKGPLKGEKMTEMEGFNFVVRLLNTYLEKQPPSVRSMAPKPRALRPQVEE